MKKRPFFPLFFRNRAKLQYLSVEQRGQLLTALYDYAEDGIQPEFEGMMGLAFEVFRDDIDSSLEHYQRQSEKNRLNGKKGAIARWGGTNSKRHDLNSKNSQSEGEGEEEADTEADTDVSLSCTADTVSNHFIALFHREPSKEFLKTVKQSLLGEQDILLAIERSKSVEIQNPEGYATRLLQAWEHTGVPNQTQKETSSESQQMEEWEKEWLAEFRAEQAALDRENL